MPVDIDQVLDREWQQIAASPEANRALRRWALRQPALRPCSSLDDLLDRRRDGNAAEPILRALFSEGRNDELAARVALQALLPGLVKIARDRRTWQSGAMDDIIGIAWQEIRDYRLELPGRIAPSVILNTRRRYLNEFAADGMLEERRFAPKPTQSPNPEECVLARLDLEAIIRGVDTGYVTAATMGTIVRTRVFGLPLADEAEAAGVTVHAMTLRRLQAESKLRHLEPLAA